MSVVTEIILALALLFLVALVWGFLQQLFPEVRVAEVRRRRKGVEGIGVAVICACHDGTGKYLFAKRSSRAQDERGVWDFGGGGVEYGERVERALAREFKEEFGVTLHDIEFLGFRDVHRTLTDGTLTHWIALDYRARVHPSEASIGEPDMTDAIAWHELSGLPSPLHSQLLEFVEKYRAKLT